MQRKPRDILRTKEVLMSVESKQPPVQIIRAPTAEDLKLTPQQERDLRELREWEKKGVDPDWMVGEPGGRRRDVTTRPTLDGDDGDG